MQKIRHKYGNQMILAAAKIKGLGRIESKDWRALFLVGFWGYFIANAALLLGIQYSNASFSSLINSTCPIFMTLFAAVLLREKIHPKDALSLLAAVVGAI